MDAVPLELDRAVRRVDLFTNRNPGGRRNRWEDEAEFSFLPIKKGPFKYQRILRRNRGVHSKASADSTPAIFAVLAIEIQHGALIEISRIDAVIRCALQLTSVLECSEALLETSASGFNHRSMGVGRLFCENADDAINGVGPPDRSSRTPDHFDAVDIAKRQ